MDDACSRGCNGAKSVHMRHDIVPALFLLDGGDVKLLGRQVLSDPKVVAYRTSLMFSDASSTSDRKTLTKFASIWFIASSEIGRPSCFSDFARLSQSLRQVKKRLAGEKRYAISLLAYRLLAARSDSH